MADVLDADSSFAPSELRRTSFADYADNKERNTERYLATDYTDEHRFEEVEKKNNPG